MNRCLTLRLSPPTLRAAVEGRRGDGWAAEIEAATPAEVADAIARLAAEPSLPGRVRGVAVQLAPPAVQYRRLHGLPPVRSSALRSLVALQAGRFFRQNGSPLLTNAIWIARERGEAWAAAAEARWIEAAAEGARAVGLAVVSVQTDAAPAGRCLDLLPPVEQRRLRRAGWVRARRLAIVALALWGAVPVIWAARLLRERRLLTAEVAQLKAPAQAALKARRAEVALVAIMDALRAAGARRGDALSRLAATAAALPDSAWLTSFEDDGKGNGVLTGAAPRAAAVMAALERAGALSGPRLDGAAVRQASPAGPREGFTIRFGRDGPR